MREEVYVGQKSESRHAFLLAVLSVSQLLTLCTLGTKHLDVPKKVFLWKLIG
jgi:nucleoside recognition membrane protein YjiH